jgi:hypothetical protein
LPRKSGPLSTDRRGRHSGSPLGVATRGRHSGSPLGVATRGRHSGSPLGVAGFAPGIGGRKQPIRDPGGDSPSLGGRRQPIGTPQPRVGTKIPNWQLWTAYSAGHPFIYPHRPSRPPISSSWWTADTNSGGSPTAGCPSSLGAAAHGSQGAHREPGAGHGLAVESRLFVIQVRIRPV